jgi:adenosyl cobinamide kinase/adenosyl cobinamide phosphate guanylyltransferase
MSTLVIGGKYQGKLEYVLKAGNLSIDSVSDGSSCSFENALEKPVLNNLHLLVKRLLEAEKDPSEFIFASLQKEDSVTIICDEIGCGIVPTDQNDRLLREATGRILCEIAKAAQKVIRVQCGIPVVIKDEI